MLSQENLFEQVRNKTSSNNFNEIIEIFKEIVEINLIYLDNPYTQVFKMAVAEKLPTRLILEFKNQLMSIRQILNYPDEVFSLLNSSKIFQEDIDDIKNGNQTNFDRERNNEEQEYYLNLIVTTQAALLTSAYRLENQISSSGINITREGIKFSPIVNYLTGIDLFNEARCTLYVPYIQYVDNLEETKIKVYTSNQIKNRPRYSLINEIIKENKVFPSVISFVVWVGNLYNQEKYLSDAPSTDFIVVEYDLELNIIDIPLNIKGAMSNENSKKIIISRLQEAFPIDFGNPASGKIGGNCKFSLNYEINEVFLLDLILNDVSTNNLLYVEETREPFYLKPNSYFYYRQMFSDLKAGQQKLSKISYNRADVTFTIDIADKMINVNILNANNLFLANEFLMFFKLILLRLAEQDIINYYLKIYSVSIINDFKILSAPSVSFKDDITRNKNYYDKEATKKFIFSKDPTTCSSHKPKLIENSEEYQRIYFQRQIMTLPTIDGSTISYYCQTNERSFPGLKFTNDQYQPCCYAKDNLNDPNSTYNYWLTDRDPKIKKGGRSTHINTLKIIEARGNTGELPSNLNGILSQGAGNFKRMGVTFQDGNNSFLQAVYFAINRNFLNDDDLYRLRQHIASSVRLEVAKQELYEYSLENIEKMILNPLIYFDPLLFYRLVEEYFKINLFFFSPEGFSKKQTSGDLVFPNTYLVPFKRIDYKNTVLIYINPGTSYGSSNTFICELIISEIDNFHFSVFDDKIKEICLNLYYSKMKINNWEYVNGNLVSLTNLEISSNLVNDLFNFDNQIIPLSQNIDKYGKTRAINFKYLTDNFTFLISPSAPYNLPSSDEIFYLDVNSFLINKFNNFVSITKINEFIADGLWLKGGNEDKIYLPLKQFNVESKIQFINLPVEESHPLSKKTLVGSLVQRNMILRKIANVLSELLIYFFQLYRLNSPPSFNSDLDFIEQYFFLETETIKKDSLYIYDISKISRRFYPTNSLNDSLNYYRQIIPTFVKEKLYFYNQNFLRNCSYLISNYFKNLTTNIVPTHISISRWYSSVYDFNINENNLIFLNNEEYQKWLVSTSGGSTSLLKMVQNLTFENSTRKNPYLTFKQGRYYLVQNVNLKGVEGYLKSLQIASYWYHYTINPNLSMKLPSIDIIPQHRVLTIDDKNELIVFSDFVTDINKKALEVLIYTPQNLNSSLFAALLPL